MIFIKTNALLAIAATILACFQVTSAQEAVQCKVIPHGQQSAHKLGPAIPLIKNQFQITRSRNGTSYNDKDFYFFVNPFPDRTIFQTTKPEDVKFKYVFTIGMNNRSIVQVPLDTTLDNFCSTDLVIDPDMVKDIVVHRTV